MDQPFEQGCGETTSKVLSPVTVGSETSFLFFFFFTSKILSLLVSSISSGPHAPRVFIILQCFVSSGWGSFSIDEACMEYDAPVTTMAICAFLLRD